MLIARFGPVGWLGTAHAALTRRPPLRVPVLFFAATLLFAMACSDQRPTEVGSDPRSAETSTASAGVFLDDFTDANGTRLQDHIPTGGGDSFRWVLPLPAWGVDAFIQDNAVGASGPDSWAHVTSQQTGDWAELIVDVFGDVQSGGVDHDIILFLRTRLADINDGYAVLWSISPDVNIVTVDRIDLPNATVQRAGAVSQGLHTFRAEITGSSEIKVTIDGEVVLTTPLGALVSPASTGMGFSTNGSPTVRITSFAASGPCPPTGDPVLDDATNLAKFDSSFQASNPTGPQNDRKEHIRAGYRFPDGHVESVDLNPPSASGCEIPDLFLPLTNGDGKLIWIWHSHPFDPEELVTQCGQRTLTTPVPYPSEPSDEDWEFLDAVNNRLFIAGEPPVPGYIYDKKYWFRMNPNVVGELPRFQYVSGDRSACR